MTWKLLWMQMTAQIDIVGITFYRCVCCYERYTKVNTQARAHTAHSTHIQFYQFQHVQITWSSLEFQLFVYFCQFSFFLPAIRELFLCWNCFSFALLIVLFNCSIYSAVCMYVPVCMCIIFVRILPQSHFLCSKEISNCVSYIHVTIFINGTAILLSNIGSLQCAMFRSQL